MKETIAILILIAGTLTAQTLVPRLAWTVETSTRETKRLDLHYGETVDLECKFLNYARPLNIEGATVTLHATTNGMPEGSSFQLAGVASTNGLARIRLPVDSWIPQGLTNFPYTIEVVQTNSARILRARGTAYVSGTSAASTNAPVPSYNYTNLVPITRTVTVNGVAGSLSSNLTFNVESSDSDTNNVLRINSRSDQTFFIEWEGSTGIVYQVDTSPHVTFSRDFADSDGNKPPRFSYPYPFSEDGWACYPDLGGIYLIHAGSWENGNRTWHAFPEEIPATLTMILGDGTGQAYVSYTNVIGIIPPTSPSAYTWQGSRTIPAIINSTNFYGIASGFTNSALWLLPETNTKHMVTGYVDIACSRYITAISYDQIKPVVSPFPVTPIIFNDYRLSDTTWRIEASISTQPYDEWSTYFAAVSNLVVYSFDRTDIQALAVTNDAAGVIAQVDSLPVSGGAPVTTDGYVRNVVNAETMRKYVDSRKTEIADAAWSRTPSGRDVPDLNIVTIDEPLVQQGAVATLQSGDYYMFSYAGNDWYSTSTGSVWRVGPAGRTAFEISSTNRMLLITGFSVAANIGHITIATNWIVSTPSIEVCSSLLNPQWIACPFQTVVNNTSNWTGTCLANTSNRFYRVVDPSGDNHITSYFRHEFPGGATIRGPLVVPNSMTFSNGVKLTLTVNIGGTNYMQLTDPTGITNANFKMPW